MPSRFRVGMLWAQISGLLQPYSTHQSTVAEVVRLQGTLDVDPTNSKPLVGWLLASRLLKCKKDSHAKAQRRQEVLLQTFLAPLRLGVILISFA
ncbi:MAG: hypothetical protein COA78_02010 [Blastopirellula sp.]|nr:MAG: hypothetical protein COA78_02010 [Blastopirellula sp.]